MSENRLTSRLCSSLGGSACSIGICCCSLIGSPHSRHGRAFHHHTARTSGRVHQVLFHHLSQPSCCLRCRRAACQSSWHVHCDMSHQRYAVIHHTVAVVS